MYIHTDDAHNTRAATEVVPLIMQTFQPTSILDVGCGTGTWLQVFSKQASIQKLVGVDGTYIDMNKLVIPESMLIKQDLTKPLQLDERFDLVMSLEVAEHLPEEAADCFIKSLVNHSDTIIFSAAIPEQGGYRHLNEQWPSYWVEKFAKLGYQAYDIIRPLIWDNPQVDAWYKQNILVFSNKKLPYSTAFTVNVIHPDYWLHRNGKIKTFQHQLDRIKNGQVGLLFPLKSFFKSALKLGRIIK